ncbi:hypothetical protein KKH27_06310, partial [bacterium]|nr:hypothetical protein [bacterium]
RNRFAAKDFALASMLDAAASVAADVAAQRIEDHFGELLLEDGRAGPNTGIVRYSPGYCGWDITGQERLFAYLSQDQIGVSLNESNLMEPLKSVSGVVIAGPKEIHDYPMSYPSCGHCDTRGCRARIRAVLAD